MIHTPNGSILPCVLAFHKINIGYPVTTNLATLHCIRQATKHDAISASDGKAQRTHDCASILDSIAKKTSCFHYFSHGASLHHCSLSRMIFTLVLYAPDLYTYEWGAGEDSGVWSHCYWSQ